jgi:hypothetical protein
MTYWLLHLTGIDTQQSRFYDFWSGIATQLSLIGGMVALYRHKNCYVRRCWRLGHPDPEHNHPACRKHHSRAEALDAAKSKASREA